MIRAHSLTEATGDGPTVRLAFEERHRRRLALRTTDGEAVLLDLDKATRLRDGQRIAMDDGRVLTVEALPEAVVDITAADAHGLARLSWHLGNRHTPTEIMPDRLRIRREHVLEAMVERLGGTLSVLDAPFDPEVGAYHDGGGHGHHHAHDHHGHGHAHDH